MQETDLLEVLFGVWICWAFYDCHISLTSINVAEQLKGQTLAKQSSFHVLI